MKASEAIKYYDMIPHEENGLFVVRDYVDNENTRPASGSIYYYLAPNEISLFHVVDCDEYWIHIEGEPLEMWIISKEGKLSKPILGLGENREPLIFVKAGEMFAAKHFGNPQDGTFVSCITVPRFTYDGWRLVDKEEVLAKCPDAKDFF